MGEPSVAVIDIGSGSVKLLVTDGSGLEKVGSERAQRAVKTRLAAGTESRLSAESLAATGEALSGFASVIDEHQPDSVAVVATAAARSAPNVGELEALVGDCLGVDLEVLSGDREAELALAGASAGRDLPGPVSIVDIGAGSTEFAIAETDGSVASFSLPVGGRTLTDHYLHGDPYRPEELSSALTVMELHTDDLKRELPQLADALDGGTLLGSGAVTQIAQVEFGSQDPDHSVDGYRLEKSDLEEVFRVLATETAADRAFNPGLKPHHVDDIVGAMCVLVGFMRQYAVNDLIVSERSLMHGLAAELLAGS